MMSTIPPTTSRPVYFNALASRFIEYDSIQDLAQYFNDLLQNPANCIILDGFVFNAIHFSICRSIFGCEKQNQTRINTEIKTCAECILFLLSILKKEEKEKRECYILQYVSIMRQQMLAWVDGNLDALTNLDHYCRSIGSDHNFKSVLDSLSLRIKGLRSRRESSSIQTKLLNFGTSHPFILGFHDTIEPLIIPPIQPIPQVAPSVTLVWVDSNTPPVRSGRKSRVKEKSTVESQNQRKRQSCRVTKKGQIVEPPRQKQFHKRDPIAAFQGQFNIEPTLDNKRQKINLDEKQKFSSYSPLDSTSSAKEPSPTVNTALLDQGSSFSIPNSSNGDTNLDIGISNLINPEGNEEYTVTTASSDPTITSWSSEDLLESLSSDHFLSLMGPVIEESQLFPSTENNVLRTDDIESNYDFLEGYLLN